MVIIPPHAPRSAVAPAYNGWQTAKCFQQEVAVFGVRSRSKANSLNPLAYRSTAKSIRKHIEVLEDVAVDADVLAALRNLSAQGYIIALDDFFYQERLRPLVELADIIKIDVLASGRTTVAEQVKLLRQSIPLP